MVVISSVTANAVARAIVGNDHILQLPAYHLGSAAEYPLHVVLGLVAGVLGWGFTRGLYLIEDVCDRAWRSPEWLRPAVGGLLLGGVLLVLPQMYGVGHAVLEAGIAGKYAIGLLVLLMLGTMLVADTHALVFYLVEPAANSHFQRPPLRELPDPFDRFIVATAAQLGLPLVSPATARSRPPGPSRRSGGSRDRKPSVPSSSLAASRPSDPGEPCTVRSPTSPWRRPSSIGG